jgi:lactobin A/cerein 7B family class IIb bacteriocin
MIPIELTDAELDAVSGGIGNVNIASIFSQLNQSTMIGVAAVVAGAAAVSFTQALAQTNVSS